MVVKSNKFLNISTIVNDYFYGAYRKNGSNRWEKEIHDVSYDNVIIDGDEPAHGHHSVTQTCKHKRLKRVTPTESSLYFENCSRAVVGKKKGIGFTSSCKISWRNDGHPGAA